MSGDMVALRFRGRTMDGVLKGMPFGRTAARTARFTRKGMGALKMCVDGKVSDTDR